jgi:hypothetical protein
MMTRKPPTPVRFEANVAARLQAYVAARPGLSLSSAANRLVDEGLRMTEHPGITFREGPTGRRAGLVGGPDVWEVVRAVRSARAAEPELRESALLSMVSENTGLARGPLRAALRYWAAYPDEVDAEVTVAHEAERAAERAWEREQNLLAG